MLQAIGCRSVWVGLVALTVALAAGALSGGCARSAPERNLFAIALTPAGAPRITVPRLGVVRVELANVSPPYSGRSFVYRLGQNRYDSDFYNQFVIAPSDQLTSVAVRYLQDSGQFKHVVSGAETPTPDLRLETSVTDLYGDYRVAKSPAAYVRVRFLLLRDTGTTAEVVGQWTFEMAQPLEKPDAQSLVAGWNRAYQKVLEQFVESVRKLPLAAQ